MTPALGLIAVLVALVSWGFGDFSIQRAVRGVGATVALFAITAFGMIVPLPFAWRSIPTIIASPYICGMLALAAAVVTIAAYFEFASFRIGKLSVQEPVLSFELVLTVSIGIAFLGDRLTLQQILLATIIFLGILLTVYQKRKRRWWQRHEKSFHLEPGVLLAIAGTLFMTFANVFTGLGSQAVANGFAAIWFINLLIALFCLALLLAQRRVAQSFRAMRRHWRPVLAECVFDNTAWIAYAVAVTALSISLTIAMTESYIALAAFLGVVWNKEKLQRHQYAGMILAIAAAIVLAAVSG